MRIRPQHRHHSINQFLSAAPVRSAIALIWAVGTWQLIRTNIQATRTIRLPISVISPDNRKVTWEPHVTRATLRGSYANITELDPSILTLTLTAPTSTENNSAPVRPYTIHNVLVIPEVKHITFSPVSV